MSDVKQQLLEDRATRDAARALFQADISFIQEDLERRSVGSRLADRIGIGTMDLIDDAADFAQGNKEKIATAGAAVIVLWFAGRPLFNLLGSIFGADEGAGEDGAEPERDGDRSGEENADLPEASA